MSPLQQIFRLALALFAVTGVSPVLAHELEIIVGRSGAGEIHVHMDFPQPVELPVSIFPGIGGYAFGELAFHSISNDEPGEDLFQLAPGAELRMVLLSKDPGIEVWNDTGSGFMATNQTYYIGSAPFDAHPIWNIVDGFPGNSYSLTMMLRDLNQVYEDSEPFVLSFTPVRIDQHLGIRQVDPEHVGLFWPTNALSWELQSAGSVAATNWATVTNASTIVGTNRSVTISVTGTERFFRLRGQ